jgi:predicted secreted protein
MAAETFTYTPKRLLASSDPDVIVKTGTLVTGQNLAQYTLLESDAAGKWKVHAGVNKVAGILLNATDATSADQPTQAYIAGDFFADQLVFPSAINTNLLKQKLVEGSMIALTFLDTGEV